MADLIYTRRPDAQPLTLDNIVHLAPAAFTDGASTEVSKRYNNFDTMQAIQVLGTYGYLPVQAAQRKSRKGDNKMYTQHMLAFAHKWNLLDRDRPEIILYNSHDGKSSLRLFAGMFRGICSNGLVAGEGFEGRMRHMNLDDTAFYDMVDDVAHTIPKMTEVYAGKFIFQLLFTGVYNNLRALTKHQFLNLDKPPHITLVDLSGEDLIYLTSVVENHFVNRLRRHIRSRQTEVTRRKRGRMVTLS